MKRLNESTGLLEVRKKQTVMDMDIQADAAQRKLKAGIKKARKEVDK